ncbi:phosphotransferase [Desulfocicer niacini]
MMKNKLDIVVTKRVLAQYPFFKGFLDSFSLIPQKLKNNNAVFQIGERKWVIKQYDPEEINERFQLSHQFQKQIFDFGFPIPKLEVARCGDSLVREGNFFYSVHQWVSGFSLLPFMQNISVHEETILDVAQATGNLHRLSGQLFGHIKKDALSISTGFLFKKARLNTDTLFSRNGWRISFFNQLRLKFRKNEFDRWILSRLNRLSIIASKIESLTPSYDCYFHRMIPIHNDIGWDNLIFDKENRLLAMIDFDNLIVGPQVYELGGAAIVICGPDEAAIEKFIEVYSKISGLVFNHDAIMIAMAIKCLGSILFSLQFYANTPDHLSRYLIKWCLYLEMCLEFVIGGIPGFSSI